MAALEAAVSAQASWAHSAPRDRSRILRRAAEALRDESEQMARLLTAEMGKPLAESRAEVEFAADYLEWFAEEAVRIGGRTCSSPDGESQHLVVRTPVGPCLVVTPWNFPLAVPARAIGPALAAGCTLVLRPSSLTPLSAPGARAAPSRGRPSGRRPQHRGELGRRGDRPASLRRAHPQADLHRLGGRRPPPDRKERRPGAAGLGRARRLRPVPGLRRCRHGRRDRGCRRGQDAKRRGGLHRGQPLLRRAVGLRRVHPPPGRADRRGADRTGHPLRRRLRADDQRTPGRASFRAGR